MGVRSSPAGGEEKFSENFPPFFPPEIVVQKLRVTYLVFRISFLGGKGRQGGGGGGGKGREGQGTESAGGGAGVLVAVLVRAPESRAYL